jgi:hypothetical protein
MNSLPYFFHATTVGGAHPVGRIVQHRAFGAFAGRRYGSFGNSSASTAPSIRQPTQVTLASDGLTSLTLADSGQTYATITNGAS